MTRTLTLTRTPTERPTATDTPSPTLTRTPSNTRTFTLTPTVTRTRTDTPTSTVTPTHTHTPTATNTRTFTPTRTFTSTPTITLTPTLTKTPTPTVPPEPVITFIGITRADDALVDPIGSTDAGIPIFQRPSYGFSLVIEGRPGGSRSNIGSSTFTYDASDPTVLPYLLIEVSQPLGDGSAAVCDDNPGMFGGVPAVAPPDFSATQPIADAINDLACRFKDGGGFPSGRALNDACTRFDDGSFHFVSPTAPRYPSTIQFCGQINKPISFPVGDTLVTIRIRDLAGHVSDPAQLIIRVEGQ